MIWLQLLGLAVGICGLIIIIIHGGWWLGLGVFLMLWGDKYGTSRSGPTITTENVK